jgi:hypothetical protein
MPFNSKTYHVNKWRRQRADNMAMARDAKQWAEGSPDVQRTHWLYMVSYYVRCARMANMMLRSAIRYKAIATAPLSAFMPGGRYYEEPNT